MPASATKRHHSTKVGLNSPPAAFGFRVLVEAPSARTIPIFALGIEAGRAAFEQVVLTEHEAVKSKVSGNTGRALQAGRYGEHHLINMRVRLGQRLALYSSWVAFAHKEDAEVFVWDHPRLGFRAMQARTASAITELEARLRDGTASDRFDLGRIDQNARLKRAREFIQLNEELDKLRGRQSAVNRLEASLAANPDGQSVG